MKDEGGRMNNEPKDTGTRRRGDTGIGIKSPRPRITASSRIRVSPSLHPAPRPSKRLGQNFLNDSRIIDRIIQALDPKSDETIIEIGPGRGALTAQLVEKAGAVVAIEFDRNLIPGLLERFGSSRNFKLVQSDALITDFCSEIKPCQSGSSSRQPSLQHLHCHSAALNRAAKLLEGNGPDAAARSH